MKMMIIGGVVSVWGLIAFIVGMTKDEHYEGAYGAGQQVGKVITAIMAVVGFVFFLIGLSSLGDRKPRRYGASTGSRASTSSQGRRRRNDRDDEDDDDDDEEHDRRRQRGYAGAHRASGRDNTALIVGGVVGGVVLLVLVIVLAARKRGTDSDSEDLVFSGDGGHSVANENPERRPTPNKPALPPGYKEKKPEGGFLGDVDFREFRQDGSMLIGFELSTSDLEGWNTEVLAYLRPIYRTSTGEQFGTAYGRGRGQKQTVKARNGYALGGVVIAGGGHLEGFCFTFMRVREGGGLDPKDAYVSEWYGEKRRKPGSENQMKSGDGSVVVGIHGTRFEDKGGFTLEENGGVCKLGLIVGPSK
jgi:hypothetical protein